MSLYTIGGLFDPDRTSWEEGTEYNYAAGQHVIKLVWKQLTLSEVAAVDHGPLQFALFTEEDQIILFIKLGEVSGWSEMPYTIWRVPEEDRAVPTIPDPKEHAGITIFLVQAENRVHCRHALSHHLPNHDDGVADGDLPPGKSALRPGTL